MAKRATGSSNRSPSSPGSSSEGIQLSNVEIVLLAIYLMGGESRPVLTEDVAHKSNEIAPGRFTWKKYRDQINLEDVRKSLSDAKRPQKYAGSDYVRGSHTHGWFLTESGLRLAKKNAARLKDIDLSKPRLTARDRQWRRVERNRIFSSETYLKFLEEGIGAISRREAEALFRIDEYVVEELREQKITRLLNAFGDDPNLGSVLKALASKAREV